MVIETSRLRIHVASDDEMIALIEGESDEDLAMAYRSMLLGCIDHPDQYVWYAVWMIELKDGTPVGNLSFKGLGEDGSVEIGYGMDEEHRGRGFATEAVGAAVAWALDQPDVTRVEAETEPDNLASQRVLAKCGFVPTGSLGEEGPRFAIVRPDRAG